MKADLDRRLREYGMRWRNAHPQAAPLPRFEAPQRRRWLVSALPLAVAVLVVVAVSLIAAGLFYRHARPTATPGAVVVPWNNTGVRPDNGGPVPAYYALNQPAPRTMRACTNDDFALAPVAVSTRPDDAQGALITTATLRRISSTPCSVTDGLPNADLLDVHGVQLPNDEPLSAGPVPLPEVVRPGQLLLVDVSWYSYQGRSAIPARIALWPGDHRKAASAARLTISVAGVAVPPHPVSVHQRSLFRAGAIMYFRRAATDGTLATLRTAYTGPTTIALNDTLRYHVTLTNAGTRPVSLNQCPTFTELLSVVPLKQATITGQRGPLNCGAAPPAIPAGSAITFAVELPTTGQVRGQGQLTWDISNAHATADAAIVSVTVK